MMRLHRSFPLCHQNNNAFSENMCCRFPLNFAAGYFFAYNLSTRFFIVGSVRAESFTRLPPSLHPASMTDSHIANGEGTECVPNTTADDQLVDDDELNLSKTIFIVHV